MRLNLKFLRACSQEKKKDFPERFILLLVRLFMLKEVKPSPDSKMITLLTFDNLFLPLRHSRLNAL